MKIPILLFSISLKVELMQERQRERMRSDRGDRQSCHNDLPLDFMVCDKVCVFIVKIA